MWSALRFDCDSGSGLFFQVGALHRQVSEIEVYYERDTSTRDHKECRRKHGSSGERKNRLKKNYNTYILSYSGKYPG